MAKLNKTKKQNTLGCCPLTVEVFNKTTGLKYQDFITNKALKQWMSHIFSELRKRKILVPKQKQTLTLVFVGGRQMRELNYRFRKKNVETDVLSFAPVVENSLGELVLCLKVIKHKVFLLNREAGEVEGISKKKQLERGLFSVSDFVCYLVLHGVLHLLGFRHENGGEEAKRMYRIQDSIFGKDLYQSRHDR